MRALVQRVSEARVTVDSRVISRIGPGLLVLAGFEDVDTLADLDWMAIKLARMRIFADEGGVMNRSVTDVGGEILAVSQFTLYASTRKGNRPSWSRAATGRCLGRCSISSWRHWPRPWGDLWPSGPSGRICRWGW